MPLQYIHILISLTLVVSFFCVGFFSKKQWVFIQIILMLNLLAECVANYFWYNLHISNAIVYNMVNGYNFIFWLLILKPKHTNLLIILFAIFCIVNVFFLQGYDHFNSLTYLLGTFIICVVIIYFYYQNFVVLQLELSIKMYTIVLLMAIFLYHVGFATILFTNIWGATKIYLFPNVSIFSLVAGVINTLFYVGLMTSMLLFKKEQLQILVK